MTGRVIDASSGDPIIGVNVMIAEIKKVTATDVNGRYVLAAVPAGEYTLVFQMMGYNRSSARVTVKPGVPNALNVSLSFQTTDEVVVEAKRLSNTEAALLAARKKAAVVQDAISSEQIAKSPDSNASDAVKRVTGITVDKGNNIVIRGLGERYASAMFADSVIPSPDPDKRIVPMDIFPVGLLDNLTVVKAYTPDRPGEFCGGVVQINPKDYPEEFEGKVSVGISAHERTLGKKFWTYPGGKWDWFGVDDGTRAKPKSLPKWNLNLFPDFMRIRVGWEMQNVYTPEKSYGYPGGSLQFSVGDSITFKEKYTLGMIASGVFKEDFRNVVTDYFRIQSNFQPVKKYRIEDSKYGTTKGALFSLGFSTGGQKLRSTTFYTHQSSDSTRVTTGYNKDRQESVSGIDLAKQYQLQMVMSDLLFTQLSGEHHFPRAAKSTIAWSGSYARASRTEPDTRNVILIDRADDGVPGLYSLYRSDDVKRWWMEHVDWTMEGTASYSVQFKQWSGIYAKVKAGGGYSYRKRVSDKRSFQWQNDGSLNPGVYDPIDVFLSWPFIEGAASGPRKFSIKETTAQFDEFSGSLSLASGYGMIDFPLIKEIRLVGGARYEYSDMDIRYFDPTRSLYRDAQQEPLDKHNVMPGVSLTYSPISDINLRGSFSKTVARPDFREVIEFKYLLLSKDAEVKGNPNLEQTDIYNYDFRIEWFPSASEIIAASFFYKYLSKPIEMIELIGSAGTDIYTYKNAEYATNLGCEIELRKNFGYGPPRVKAVLEGFSALFNFTYVHSRIRVSYVEKKQLDPENPPGSVLDLINTTFYTNRNRPLQGQSPWIVNTGFEYANNKIGLDVSLLFNIFGPRIVRVGTLRSYVPYGDVYEEGFPKLDLMVKQNILEYGHIKFTASNLIDPKVRLTQEITHSSYLYKRKITTESYRVGRNFSLSYGYSF
ncbi:MAG: TonB-dependent receptor [Spirochaetes bacterium]|nr:TonB-dependent receptor [Spirochaetota bacterium]